MCIERDRERERDLKGAPGAAHGGTPAGPGGAERAAGLHNMI